MNQNTKRLKQELQQLRDEYNHALEPLKQDLQNVRAEYRRAKALLSEAEAQKHEAWDWLYEDVDKFGPKKGCMQRKEIITKEQEPDHLVFYGRCWYWASTVGDLDYEEYTSYKSKECKYFDSLSETSEECKECQYKWQYEHYIKCLQHYCNQEIEFENGGYSQNIEQAKKAIQECNDEYLPKIKNAEHAYLKQKWGFLFPIVIKIKQSKNL